MFRITFLFIMYCFALSLFSDVSQAAWPWSKTQNLVTINGTSYTADDYMHWWENWSEKDSNASHDIQRFIEWKLLVQEALSMELDQTPTLKRKNEVFLNVRRRLLFKNETVDSKIKISEQDRKERFEADYSPVSFFTFLYFLSEEKALEVSKSIKEGLSSFDAIKELPESEGGPHQVQQGEYYPIKFKENARLQENVGALKIGDVSQVFPAGKFFILGRLDKQEPPDAGLYENAKKSIQSRMVKEQSSRYTSELINSLMQKYEVRINEDLFAQANADMEGEILNRQIVTTNKAGIPLALLVKDIRKEHSFRKVEDWPVAERVKLYRGLLNGMIIEYLITWESGERHYEKNPPFKWVYEHNVEKNLIGELERLLINSKVSVSEEDIITFYQEHIEDYKGPDLVTIIMLDAEKDIVQEIWQKVQLGSDLFEFGNRENVVLFPLEDFDVRKLDPEMSAVVQELAVGEVSSPFELNKDRLVLLKLLDRTPGKPQPLESVKETIVKKLKREGFQQARGEYIEKLLAHSEIAVNDKAWEKLVADQKQ